MPIYVVAVEGGQAWLQGDGDPAVPPLEGLHWKAARGSGTGAARALRAAGSPWRLARGAVARHIA
jgi:hypothetical protein